MKKLIKTLQQTGKMGKLEESQKCVYVVPEVQYLMLVG